MALGLEPLLCDDPLQLQRVQVLHHLSKVEDVELLGPHGQPSPKDVVRDRHSETNTILDMFFVVCPFVSWKCLDKLFHGFYLTVSGVVEGDETVRGNWTPTVDRNLRGLVK